MSAKTLWKPVLALFVFMLAAALLVDGRAQDVKKKEDSKKEEKKPEEKKAEEKKVDEKKPEEKKVDAVDQAKRLREASEKLRQAMDKASEDYRKAMDKAHEEYRQELDKLRADGGPLRRPAPPLDPLRGRPWPGKLGMVVSPVVPFVADQLGLEKDRGLTIVKVIADSPAGKAGLKENDILLTLDGKAVTSRIQDLERIIGEIKAKTPVDAEVHRRGKKETIKGIELPEAPPRVGAR